MKGSMRSQPPFPVSLLDQRARLLPSGLKSEAYPDVIEVQRFVGLTREAR